MKKLLFALLASVLSLAFVPQAKAQTTDQGTYSIGVVTALLEQTTVQLQDNTGYTQKLSVREKDNGVTRIIQVGSENLPVDSSHLYKVGQQVVILAQKDEQGQLQYDIVDQYRVPSLLWLLAGFFAIVIAVSLLKGFTSLLGMCISMLVILFFMVPQIIGGANPVTTSIIAAGIISAIIIYFGHGFHYRSHVALFCMLVTLGFVGLLSHYVVQWTYLSGGGEETATYLQFLGLQNVNLQGLYLGGIILAALSVLDDSVISQVSVLYQLKQVKKEISFRELFDRGMEVGRDHISTLVNTLILAYAGSSLPLFILFTLNKTQPAWLSLNDQLVAEEVVRTLTGSIGLVLSIPLTTLIAAYVIHRKHRNLSQK
ncbi:MAG TPA: YibE/F family protein [Patescibacteria group bacterium]|nr:YibE/F family protein [Patescibacteria group bacterium]